MNTSQGSPAGSGWVLGGRYRVAAQLGSGGMAQVFRAHDELLDRDVAVKVFRAVAEGDDTDAAGGVTHGRRALELQALARLSHPHLITLYDGSMAVDAGEPSYLVMELVDGADLAVRLRGGPLPAAQAREIGAQIASALAYVHAQGMVHRDVKPANILLGAGADTGDLDHPQGVRARLSDFGVVRLLGSPRMTAAAMTMGTASYLAPEQARGGDVDAPADVYALGLVLIEALTGRRSFDGPVLETMAARLARPPEIPHSLPPPWPQLLAAMTAMDPAHRPTAAQVARTLRGEPLARAPHLSAPPPLPARLSPRPVDSAPSLPVGPPPGGPGTPPRSGPRATLWLGAVAAVLLLGGLIGVLIASASQGSGGGGAPTTSSSRDTSSRRPTATSTSTSTAPSSRASSRTSRSGPASSSRQRSSPPTTRPRTSSGSRPPSSSAGSSSSARPGSSTTTRPAGG